MIDQIRASKLPSNMMQFAARGALQVSAAENIEILVYLARHNKVFGELARLTLAGWDEKSCVAAASDPQTPREVLAYFVAPDNLRPGLLPALLENPAIPASDLLKLASTALRGTVEAMLKSPRVKSLGPVVEALKASPYIRKDEAEELRKYAASVAAIKEVAVSEPLNQGTPQTAFAALSDAPPAESGAHEAGATGVGVGTDDEVVSVYLKVHATDIAAEGDKQFQAIGGVVDLLGVDYFPVTQNPEVAAPAEPAVEAPSAPKPAAVPKNAAPAVRENALQKINRLDVKGRIQLALKGNKEERSLLIRDGTKVVALAVLEAPKLADGEVEKFASQKNVLQAVLRQIPLKRRFLKNYIVVRNLVANPRTPIDLGLGLMKNILPADLKNLSGNKEVSETIRKLALKMYKQKLDASAKK
jgi:hypothetical protein